MTDSINLSSSRKPIPITVFTGFIGAGKTSIILSLFPQLPKDYKVVLLKNEFGDVEVDSQLAKQSNLEAVSEILNGCICCVLVGQMKTALLEIREKYRPDRIIIECSGSAFPATLAFQIRELERETQRDLRLDAIVTVVDAENFRGYEDTSPTARMQASYTDVILINKWEHVLERDLDIVLDHLHTLNDLTPKIRCGGREGVDPALIFGVDTKLFSDPAEVEDMMEPKGGIGTMSGTYHHGEVQTVTIWRGGGAKPGHDHVHGGACDADCGGKHTTHGDSASLNRDIAPVREDVLSDALASLSNESVWRVKGYILLPSGMQIVNWAFGRHDLTPMKHGASVVNAEVKLTVMGERGEVRRAVRRFAEALGAEVM